MKICKLFAILFSGVAITSAYSDYDRDLIKNAIRESRTDQWDEKIMDDFKSFNNASSGKVSEYKEKLDYISDYIPAIMREVAAHTIMGYEDRKKYIESDFAKDLNNVAEEYRDMYKIILLLSFRLSSVILEKATENEDIEDWLYFTFDGFRNYVDGYYKNICLTDEDIKNICLYAQEFNLEKLCKEDRSGIISAIRAAYYSAMEKKDKAGMISVN